MLFLYIRLYRTKKSAQKNTLNGSVITIWRDFSKKCNILIWCQPYLLASFILLIVHIARYIPSLNEEKISRNMRLKSYQVIFLPSLSDEKSQRPSGYQHPLASGYITSGCHTAQKSVMASYHVTLIPIDMLAFELRGIHSLLVLPRMWSMPMKKL